MMKSADIPVNDIMPLVDVPDYSFYFFIVLVVVGSAVAVSGVMFFLKKWGNRRISERKKLYERLASVDFSDPKRAAYTISELGYRFAHDNERTESAYHNLFGRLEPYKYARSVKPIDEETIGYYRLYLGIIDA